MSSDLYPLPQNIEAEQAVLGAILIEGSVMNKVLDLLLPEDFYKDAHRKIYNAMIDLERSNKPIDLITLFDDLKTKGNLLEEVGESSYLTYLTELVPTTENVLFYAKLVKEKSKERKICIDAEQISYKLKNGKINIDEARELLGITLEEIPKLPSEKGLQFVGSNELIEDDSVSLEWYIEELIPKSALILITAPPGDFKTWLALYIGKCIAKGELCLGKVSQKANVYFIDKENPKGLVISRLKKIGTDENFQFCGTWSEKEAPNLDKDISAYKELVKEDTVLIFDSLIRFHTGEENSSSDMSKVISSLRSLTCNGASIIIIHHKGKSEHSYRGSSDILAGVDICYTLIKEGEVLKLSCDTKNRFAQPFTIFLKINESEEHFEFEVANSPKKELTEIDLIKIQNTISDITQKGDEPIQWKVVEAAKKEHGLSQSRVMKLLEKGEGIYWRKVDGKHHNKKLYKAFDNQDDADTSKDETDSDESVFQFGNTIPLKKPKNWQTEVDPWEKSDI